MVSAKRKVVDTKRFFHMTGQLFADQYYHIYNARLRNAREALISSSRFRWGQDVKNLPLEQLNSSLGSTDVFVIGTLFKLMPQQPSILKELEQNQITASTTDVNFTDDKDSLVLHETDENVQVVGDINVHLHVTGIPVSLLGHQLDNGAKFYVTDICYAGLNLSVYKMPKSNEYNEKTSETSKKVLIISGLEFGFDSSNDKKRTREIVEALKRLRDYLTTGAIDGPSETCRSGEISRIIIAGNSVAPGYAKTKYELFGSSNNQDSLKSLTQVFEMFDKYLYTLAQSGAQIDVMPGKNDPTSLLLPQQPFHPRILPKSGSLQNVKPTTNPCITECHDLLFLGTSGENIEAIRQYSRLETTTCILQHTLEWGHIAPLAPDNLSCVPFKETDPFLIDFAPDVYFAANQSEFLSSTFCTETKPKIQIISVPSFVKTLSCVSVDIDSLEVEEINFNSY